MGNVSCCQPEPINTVNEKVFLPDEEDPKLTAAIQFVNLLQLCVENKFFLDYKPQAGIQNCVGVDIQNLSSLHNFVKEIKLKENESSLARASTGKKPALQNSINTVCDIIIDELKTALFELKRNTKKNVKALDFNETHNDNNLIHTPYYLPWIDTLKHQVCVYIGEWKYESRYLNKNFPHGVGRLYLNNQVWQGQIQLSIQKLQQFSSKTIETIASSLNNEDTPLRQKIHLLKNHLTLKLHGQGRKFTKDEEYIGHFQNGLLNGKGEYKNYKHDYSYEGVWVNNIKNGKGIEKTKSSMYEGEWKNNKKNGEGTLIFMISPQLEKERLKEEKLFSQAAQNLKEYKFKKARVSIDMNLEELSDRVIRETLKKNLIKYKGEEALTFQKLKFTPWDMDGFSFINKNYIENVKFEQQVKTTFCQKYVGGFLDDEFHGKGTYQWVKGNFYVGDWVKGKMEGLGKFYWKEGYVYYGEYKNDQKHGKGEMKWDPYKRHRGNWAFGKKHGYGEEIKIELNNETHNLDIIIQGGLWKKNKLESEYFKKCLQFESDPNYISVSPILKHNYFYFYPDTKLSEEKKIKLIQEEAKNYFKKPCNYCGSYILKEEKEENKSYIQNLWTGEGEAGKALKEQEDPEMCNSCIVKVKELSERKGDVNNSESKKEI